MIQNNLFLIKNYKKKKKMINLRKVKINKRYVRIIVIINKYIKI